MRAASHMNEYIGYAVGIVILGCYVFMRFRSWYRQLTKEMAEEAKETNKLRITFKDGLLLTVLTLAFIFVSLCVKKFIWGFSWEEVLIATPLFTIIVLVALALTFRAKK